MPTFIPVGRLLASNPYPGRGIIAGESPDGRYAAAAYFIMGRSENSRNRVFTERDAAVFTEPFDASLVADPSLILYAAVRRVGDRLIVTNGDQTDTIASVLGPGGSFEGALRTRRFEPDAPNFTPRISALLDFSVNFSYKMSILKCADRAGSVCDRFFYEYTPVPGRGHFIHTYQGDGNPLPPFSGDPEAVAIPGSLDEFTADIWENLNADNKISLYTVYRDLGTGEETHRIVNKHEEAPR